MSDAVLDDPGFLALRERFWTAALTDERYRENRAAVAERTPRSRRRCESPIPTLAHSRAPATPGTREYCNHAGFGHIRRWRDPDSNRGHHDFQSCSSGV